MNEDLDWKKIDRETEEAETRDIWRELALQFDAHRIEAMSMLRGVVAGTITPDDIKTFLKTPPKSGRSILADTQNHREEGEFGEGATVRRSPEFTGSCVSCNGTGDQGGNPSYGACEDCGGSGKAQREPDAATDQAIVDLADISARARSLGIGLAKYPVADVDRLLATVMRAKP